MGLFSRKKDVQTEDPLNPTSTSTAPESTSNASGGYASLGTSGAEKPRKKSLYQKYQDMKRGPSTSEMSDEDLKKYTGMDRAEFDKFSNTTPGVAGGQRAGALTAGGHSGLGTSMGAGEGLGGWGTAAGKDPVVR